MNKIRVMLVDDHTLVRQGVRLLLQANPELEVVGEAADGREAVTRAVELQPDVVLMDITMPGLDGLEAAQEIRARVPGTHVLLLTVHDDEAYLFRGLKVGASGYLLKGADASELVFAIQAVQRDQVYLHPTMAKWLVGDYLRRVDAGGEDRTALDELTDRQRQVVTLMAEGLSNQEIADRLVISPYTVQTHLAQIMHKLNLHSRADLIKYAIRHGLVDLYT